MGVVTAAGDPLVEAIAPGPPAVAIVAATPEVDHAAALPAEALRLQAAILRQDGTAVDSSRTGAKPASSHRQEASKGASCPSQ